MLLWLAVVEEEETVDTVDTVAAEGAAVVMGMGVVMTV